MKNKFKKLRIKLLRRRIARAESAIQTERERMHRMELSLESLSGELTEDDRLRELSRERMAKIAQRAEGGSRLNKKINKITNNPYVSAVSRVFAASRRYVLVTRFMKYTTAVIAFVETSATFLVTLICVLAILPFAIVIYVSFRIYCSFAFRRFYRRMRGELRENGALVFVYSDIAPEKIKDGYSWRNICTSRRGRLTLITAQRSVRTAAVAVRKIDDGIYLCNRHLLGYLKKKRYARNKTTVIWL